MPRRQKPRRVAILGGGPAGLSAAHRLLTSSTHPNLPRVIVDVYEASGRFGGTVFTESAGGFLCEFGPNSMQAKHAGVMDLIYEKLGLGDRVVKRSEKASNYYVVKDGQLVPVPNSPAKFFKSKLLTWKGKMGVVMEVFKSKGKDEKETVGEFFERRFGTEVADWLIDPMMAGIYSGRTTELGMKYALARVWNMEKQVGSVIRAMFSGKAKPPVDDRFATYTSKELRGGISYDNGMETLTNALYTVVKSNNKGGRLYRHVGVRTLDRDPNGIWRVNGRGRYDAVISTIPTYALGDVNSNVSSLERGFRRLKRKLKYAAVSVVVLGFERSQISRALDGFGALVPTAERRKMLGVTFSSSNYPTHSKDPNKVYLTVYLGGRRNPSIPFKSSHEVVEIANQEVKEVVGVQGEPCFTRMKTWYQGIPQYMTNFGEVLCTIARIERKAPGLIMAGNYRDGIGLPDALMSGINSAERAKEYMQSML